MSASARTHWMLASLLAVAAASAAYMHTEVAARFSCGFEASWSACGFAQQAKAPDRVTLVEVAGRSGVRLRTLPGDRDIAGSGEAERADLANFQVDVADFPPRLRFAISAGPVVSSGAPGSPTQRWEIGPIVKNRWYDFVYHVRWSSHGDGWFDAWVDGKQIVHYRGPTLYAGQGCYLKLANYHTPVGKPVSVVHGRVRRGPTREALSSGALP